MFIIIILSPDFCIAFFYNKKILLSFYYVCYLSKNETLLQELFGGCLDEVLGTDDDESAVAFVITQKVFRASIQEISDIENDYLRWHHAWLGCPCRRIQRDREEQEELDDDEGNKNSFDTIVPDFLTAIKYISAVKKFAINNWMTALVTDMASAETVMQRKFL